MSRLGKDKLASQLSISRQYISKLERLEDAEPPSLKVANEIATNSTKYGFVSGKVDFR